MANNKPFTVQCIVHNLWPYSVQKISSRFSQNFVYSPGPPTWAKRGCSTGQGTFFHLQGSQVGSQKHQNRKLSLSQGTIFGKFGKKVWNSKNILEFQSHSGSPIFQKVSPTQGQFFEPQRSTPVGRQRQYSPRGMFPNFTIQGTFSFINPYSTL